MASYCFATVHQIENKDLRLRELNSNGSYKVCLNNVEDCHPELLIPKKQGSLGNVGTKIFVFTNFQADNYGTSSGDDEWNSVYS